MSPLKGAEKVGGRTRGFPGGPEVKTLHFHCRGLGFDPWLGNFVPTYFTAQPKEKKRNKRG